MRPFGLRASYLSFPSRKALFSGARAFYLGKIINASLSSRYGADGITRFRYVKNNFE